MPCDDTSSRITVWIDTDDCLFDFDFTKITCSRSIGDNGYKPLIQGQNINDILAIDFSELLTQVPDASEEDQFFFYLEWDAVRSTLLQYLGHDDEIDHSRYQVLSVLHDEEGVAISQVFKPATHMPKKIPCCHSTQKKASA